MDFIFEQIRVGGDRNFSYLIADRSSKVGVCIDPANDPQKVLDRVLSQGINLSYVINTHGHHDHINGNEFISSKTTAKIAAYLDADFRIDYSINDGDSLKVGKFELNFIHTPGHAPDHLVVYLKEKEILFSGDLLFVGKVGGTPNKDLAEVEWRSLQKILDLLPNSTTVWPGHDYGCRPSTTIGLEKSSNPFLLCQSLDEFLDLKNNWSNYKQEMGLI